MVVLVLFLAIGDGKSRLPNRFTREREADNTEIFYSGTISFNSLLMPKTNSHQGLCL
jgi:hypothetical protein